MPAPALSPDGWTYRQRYVHCNAPCKTCDSGGAHGPYWYRQRKVNGKVVTEYLGKTLPEGARVYERD